ncbi:FMN-binding protein [Fundicoccus sp. Sow4_H7]|uniref:FMN-binding protein n=1 Tax=Fundicoccus sp. Sow4_H7 TaxID=3438784 RepID=UPI003F92295B
MGKKTKFVLELIAVSVIIWILTVIVFTDQVTFRSAINNEEVATMPTGELTDGTYTGEADGHNGPLKVEVVVENGAISAVNLLEHVESEAIADPAIDQIPQAIIDNNSTDIDSISGATVSSKAIITAVNNALSGDASETTTVVTEESTEEPDEETQAVTFEDGTYNGEAEGHNAPLTVEVTVTDGAISDVQVVDHQETEGISDPAIEEIPAAIVEANSTDVDFVSGASVTSEAIVNAVNNALNADASTTEEDSKETDAATYEDGTYTGEAEGHNAPLTVEVTVADGAITDVQVVEHEETQGISDPAIEEVPAAIVEANSTDVEIVSGATVSSQAIIDAVNNALSSDASVTSEDSKTTSSSDLTVVEVPNSSSAIVGYVFADGSYTGEAEGRHGLIEVEVTVENGTIADVEVLNHNESEDLGVQAIEEVTTAIVENNTTDVEVVSGASLTSQGVINATKNALGILVQTSTEPHLVYEDGTYLGEAEGFGGPIRVEVIVKDGKLNEVTILEHAETDGISDPARNEIPATIVENNTTDVAAVSGASYSSLGIINAVNNALNLPEITQEDLTFLDADAQNTTEEESTEEEATEVVWQDGTYTAEAEGHNDTLEVEVTITDGAITEVNVLNHSETEGISDPAIEEVPAAIVENNSTDVDIVSGASVSSQAIIDAVNAALAQAEGDTNNEAASFEDGTHNGTAKGHNGPLELEVVVEGGVITEINVLSHSETKGISDPAFEEVIPAIIEANSVEVDTVSGASITSNAIIDAVKDALNITE